MPLNDVAARNAKPKDKQYKLKDEKGLHLLVHTNGSKYWQFRYRYLGKEKLFSFGTYPEISLKEAREKRDFARRQISDGLDPSQKRKVDKIQQHIDQDNSFENIAREWYKKNYDKWKPRHAKYIIKRLEDNVFPALGFRPIDQITTPELLSTIQKIENRGALDIAKRALQTSGQIFRYAIATGRANIDLSASLKGVLTARKTKHHPHLKEKELPNFFKDLANYKGALQTTLGLRLIVLTFVRTSELIGAKWDEINFDSKEWHIPPDRMKMGNKHIVPISTQSLQILKELQSISGNREFIFPGQRNANNHMSNNAMLGALRRMGYQGRTTVHGFRATASTILNENSFNRDHIECQLAHCERDGVRAAYNHALYLQERHKMMQWWSDYLEGMK